MIVKWRFNSKDNTWTQERSTISHRYYHHNILNISRDGQYLTTGTANNTVAVFKSSNLSKIFEVKAHEFFVTNVAFTNDSKNLISVSADYSCAITEIKKQGNQAYFFILAIFIVLLAILIAFFFPF